MPRSMRLSPLRARVGAALLALSTVPAVAAAQVGHLPTESPYLDFKIGQTLSILAGRLSVAADPAGVAPQSSLIGGIRYDVGIGGPASLFVRYMLAPSERDLKVPTNPAATRVIGTTAANTHLADIGFDIALTGKKTWRRLLPSVNGGVGLVSDFAAADTGAYRFGARFAFNYGFSLRYVPRRGPQWRIDATRFLWQYQYPDRYFVRAADTTAILSNTRDRTAWRSNWALTAGATFPIFR